MRKQVLFEADVHLFVEDRHLPDDGAERRRTEEFLHRPISFEHLERRDGEHVQDLVECYPRDLVGIELVVLDEPFEEFHRELEAFVIRVAHARRSFLQFGIFLGPLEVHRPVVESHERPGRLQGLVREFLMVYDFHMAKLSYSFSHLRTGNVLSVG